MHLNLHTNFIPSRKVLHAHIQNRLPRKTSTCVEDRGSDRSALEFFLDLAKGTFEAVLAGDIG